MTAALLILALEKVPLSYLSCLSWIRLNLPARLLFVAVGATGPPRPTRSDDRFNRSRNARYHDPLTMPIDTDFNPLLRRCIMRSSRLSFRFDAYDDSASRCIPKHSCHPPNTEALARRDVRRAAGINNFCREHAITIKSACCLCARVLVARTLGTFSLFDFKVVSRLNLTVLNEAPFRGPGRCYGIN